MMENISKNIVGFNPLLNECGKVKTGNKGEKKEGKTYRMPIKLDHFWITTTERDGDLLSTDEEITKVYGAKAKEITIKLLFNDISLSWMTKYSQYSGKTLTGYGDGEKFFSLNTKTNIFDPIAKPVEKLKNTYTGKDKYKMTGVLSFQIKGFERSGMVHRYRTTSYNSISSITASLNRIHDVTDGFMQYIDFKLVFLTKTGKNPTTGHNVKVNYVNVIFEGDDLSLMETAYNTREKVLKFNPKILEKEIFIKSQMEKYGNKIFDEDSDVGQEFFPDNENKNISMDDLGDLKKPDKELNLEKTEADLKIEQLKDLENRLNNSSNTEDLNKVAGDIKLLNLDESSKDELLVVYNKNKSRILNYETSQSGYLIAEHNFTKKQIDSFYEKYGTVKDDDLGEQMENVEKNALKFKAGGSI